MSKNKAPAAEAINIPSKKAKVEFNDPFADTDIQPVSVAGENVPTRVAVRVKDDAGNWQVAGLLSKDYQLMPNRKIRDIADDIMARSPSNLGGFRNLKTLFDGKRYVDYFASNNPVAQIRNGQTVELNLGLMIWNAYDGTRKGGFEVFALNPFCTNQYHSRNRFGFFAFRHNNEGVNGIDTEDALSNIGVGVTNIIKVAPMIGALKKQPLLLPDLTEAKANVDIPQTRWGDVLDQLAKEENNRFGLYQALTNVASHKLGGLSAIDAGSSITDYFLPMGDGKAVMSHTTAESVVERSAREADASLGS